MTFALLVDLIVAMMVLTELLINRESSVVTREADSLTIF